MNRQIWSSWLLNASQRSEPSLITIIERCIDLPALEASMACLEVGFGQLFGMEMVRKTADCELKQRLRSASKLTSQVQRSYVLDPIMILALIAFSYQANILRAWDADNVSCFLLALGFDTFRT